MNYSFISEELRNIIKTDSDLARVKDRLCTIANAIDDDLSDSVSRESERVRAILDDMDYEQLQHVLRMFSDLEDVRITRANNHEFIMSLFDGTLKSNGRYDEIQISLTTKDDRYLYGHAVNIAGKCVYVVKSLRDDDDDFSSVIDYKHVIDGLMEHYKRNDELYREFLKYVNAIGYNG